MTEHAEPHKKTAGEILKEVRESKRIDILTVHEATKIPMDVLKAIEEGYSVRTLSSFYLKGFIKMYAEYLHVDAAKILDKSIPVLQKEKQPHKPKITQITKKVYAIPEDDFSINNLISKGRQRQIIKGIGILIGLFLCVRMIGCLVGSKDNKKAVERPKEIESVSPQKAAEQKLIAPAATAVAAKTPAPKPAEPVAKSPAAVPPSPLPEPAPEKKEPDKVRLTIKALKGGWLQVKVDGAVVLESTLNAGTVETWEADREIIISGRTIHSLEFELNGKMLGTLGRQDRNARRVIVTKKGLAVK